MGSVPRKRKDRRVRRLTALPEKGPDADCAGPADQIEGRVTVRMRRQQRLTDDPPLAFNVVVNEAALHRSVGGTDVMREQLKFLLERMELPNVDARILPFESGAHTASEGSFVIMKFPSLLENVTFGDVVLIEYRVGALYLEAEQETQPFARVFERLQATALDPRESAKRIQHLLNSRYGR